MHEPLSIREGRNFKTSHVFFGTATALRSWTSAKRPQACLEATEQLGVATDHAAHPLSIQPIGPNDDGQAQETDAHTGLGQPRLNHRELTLIHRPTPTRKAGFLGAYNHPHNIEIPVQKCTEIS